MGKGKGLCSFLNRLLLSLLLDTVHLYFSLCTYVCRFEVTKLQTIDIAIYGCAFFRLLPFGFVSNLSAVVVLPFFVSTSAILSRPSFGS